MLNQYSNRGVALGELTRFEEALQSHNRAIQLEPDLSVAHYNCAVALGELKHFEAALRSYDRAIELRPDHVEAYYNRGIALGELKRFEAALQSYDHVLQLKPDHAQAYSNRGVAMFELKRFEEALEAYDHAIRLDPEFADAHTNKGLLLLLSGKFDMGWKSGEWRKKASKKIGASNYPQPEWSGREDVAGKTLFIHWEQGLGDTIQFCRLAKLAESRGARVIVSVQDALMRLLKDLSPTIEIIASGSAPKQFDYHVALLSMPLALNLDATNIPAESPYLRAEPDRREKWKLEPLLPVNKQRFPPQHLRGLTIPVADNCLLRSSSMLFYSTRRSSTPYRTCPTTVTTGPCWYAHPQIPGRPPDRMIVSLERLFEALQLEHCDTPVGIGLRVIRLELEDVVIALKRCFETLQFAQCDAAVVVCFYMIRPELDGAIIASQRRFEMFQFTQGDGTIISDKPLRDPAPSWIARLWLCNASSKRVSSPSATPRFQYDSA